MLLLLLLLLLLLWLLDVSLLEVGSVCVRLDLPFTFLVLLELALIEQVVKNTLGIEGFLRLGLLKFKFLLELSVLALKFILTLFFAQSFFLKISELSSSTSALRANF